MQGVWRRLLSVLLASVMVLSLSVTGYATETGGAGETLALERIDPATLGVPRLGAVEEETRPGTPARQEAPLYRDDEMVRVTIVMDKAATLDAYPAEDVAKNESAMAYRSGLQRRQTAVVDRLEQKLGQTLDVRWNLTLAMNAVSANVRYGDIAAIEATAGVKRVELENRYDPQRSTDLPQTSISTEHMIFATNAWAEGYTGAGSRIAIIDTGANQDHEAFDPEALLYSLERNGQTARELGMLDMDGLEGVLEQLNANNRFGKHQIPDAQYVYKHEKIPYAFNYVDGDNDTDHGNDDQGEHGSHVAGIAAANRYVRRDGAFAEAAVATKAVGVAPDAQILVMKVFGKNGGAYDSDYMSAIEDAILLGADAINLSLGSAAPGYTFSGLYQDVMDNLVNTQSVVAVSAGNSYAWTEFLEELYDLYAEDVSMQTGGSPGSFINSLDVAAAANIGITGTPIAFDGGELVFYTESEHPGGRMKDAAGVYDYVYVDGIGYGNQYEAVDRAVGLEGKVLLCNRGESSFAEKGNDAVPYAPCAMVVINNQPGTISMALEDFEGQFPMVSITQEDGAALKERGVAGTVTVDGEDVDYYTGTVEIRAEAVTRVNEELSEAAISGFSSWGVPGSLLMKPEITAPGGAIWSVNGMGDEAYEEMSGTSMASPHVAGMAAVLGQYLRQSGLARRADGNARHLINSLLMSTASPMRNNGAYLSILQQGAGLANVFAATRAKSWLVMGDDATLSAADGKVKVELGQDAGRTGSYRYSFEIRNLSGDNLLYQLNTDLFTQNIYEGEEEFAGQMFMGRETRALDAQVRYDWDHAELTGPDVDKNGVCDYDDPQAILDYVTGLRGAKETDLDAADWDKDGRVTSYDAHLMLAWLARQSTPENGRVLVSAGGSVTVQVEMTLSEGEKERLDRENPNGAYIEGFTYVTCASTTDDGAVMDVEHSIPILGFYGSWTDASMFDNTSAIDVAYGTNDKIPYSQISDTNYLTIRNERGTAKFLGNPYAVEESFPVQRLAISSRTEIVNGTYTPLRNAGTVLPMALDGQGQLLYAGKADHQVNGPWYHTNAGAWYNRDVNVSEVKQTVSALGVQPDEQFTFGVFAVPEYYALLLNREAKNSVMTARQIAQLYGTGELGRGAMMGHTFTVDDETPDIVRAERSADGKAITVTAADNRYLAYLAIVDVVGNVVFADGVPEQEEPGESVEQTFSLEGLGETGAVAVFAGDYAGNEAAVMVRLHDGPVTVEQTVFRLTDTMELGQEYLIANTATAGEGYVLSSPTRGESTEAVAVSVYAEEGVPYITARDAGEAAVWTAIPAAEESEELVFQNSSHEGYLGPYLGKEGEPFYTWTYSFGDYFRYEGNFLRAVSEWNESESDAFMVWDAEEGGFRVSYTPQPVYLYVRDTATVEIDPDNATYVTVEPREARLIMGLTETVELRAKVEPLVLEDKSVDWSSSDEKVATVDANGVVRAVGAGEAFIKAASHRTPSVYDTCRVEVIASTPMDATICAQVTFEDGAQFAAIDLGDMSTSRLGPARVSLAGGGRSGRYLWGNDANNGWYQFDIENGYEATYHFDIDPSFAALDVAHIPTFTAVTVAEDGTRYEDTLEYAATAVSQEGLLEFINEAGEVEYIDLGGEPYLLALCYAGSQKLETGSTVLYYLAMDDEAVLYLLQISYVRDEGGEDGGLIMDLFDLGTMQGIAIGDDPTAYSMVYAGSEAAGGRDGVFLADNGGKCIYYVDISDQNSRQFRAVYVGQIAQAVNLAALYDQEIDAFPAADCLTERAVTGGLSARAVRYREATAGALQRASLRRPERPAPAARSVSSAARDDLVRIGCSEAEAITNALYRITYDPTALRFVEMGGEAMLESLRVDAKKGEILYALADEAALEAGVVAAAVFEPLACEEGAVTVKTEERCDDLATEDTDTVTVPGRDHVWGEPVWTWSRDRRTATATFTCTRCGEKTVVKDEQVKAAKDDKGQTTYTATLTGPDGKVYTDVKTLAGVDTGDPFTPGLYLALALASAALLTGGALYGRRRVRR